jgi:hypothetical protein
MNSQTARTASFSIFSILALVSAFLSFTTGAGLGLLFAGVAIVCGLLGLALSFRERTRGGVLSFFAIFAGVVGVGAAVIKLVANLAG